MRDVLIQTPDKEEDFTGDAPTEASSPGLSPPKVRPYDPEPEREKIRGWVALSLVLLLIGSVIFSLVIVSFSAAKFADLKGLLELIFAPIIAIVGSVTGFYFGGQSR